MVFSKISKVSPEFGNSLRRMEKIKVNRRVLKSLIKCGVFDFTKVFRSKLLEDLDDALRLYGHHQ